MSYPPHNQGPTYPPPHGSQPGPYGTGPQPQAHGGPGGPGQYGRPGAPVNAGPYQGPPPGSYTPPPQAHYGGQIYGGPGGPTGPGPMGPSGYNPYGPPSKKKKKTGIVVAIIIAVFVALIALIAIGAIQTAREEKTQAHEDFQNGLTERFNAMGAEEILDEHEIEQLVECVTDEVYDDLGHAARKSISEGTLIKSRVLDDATAKCATDLFDISLEDDSDFDTQSPDSPSDGDSDNPVTRSEISRSDFRAGVEKIVRESLPEGMVDESQFSELTECITEESYDKVDDEIRALVASGKDTDHPALFEAASTCIKRLNISQ